MITTTELEMLAAEEQQVRENVAKIKEENAKLEEEF